MLLLFDLLAGSRLSFCGTLSDIFSLLRTVYFSSVFALHLFVYCTCCFTLQLNCAGNEQTRLTDPQKKIVEKVIHFGDSCQVEFYVVFC